MLDLEAKQIFDPELEINQSQEFSIQKLEVLKFGRPQKVNQELDC